MEIPMSAPDAPASAEPVIDEPSTEENQDNPEVEVDPLRAKKHKYKANGKEVEVDYDELLSRASKADGAEEKFRAAKQQEKQLQELQSKLGRLSKADEDNFIEMIEVIGWEKAQKFADTLVKKKLEWEELSEQEQRQLLRDQEAEEAKAELETYKSKEQQKREHEERSIALEAVDKEVSSVVAMADSLGLTSARSPKFVEDVVDVYLSWLEYADREEAEGRTVSAPPPSPEDVARIIQERYDQHSNAYLKKLSAKDLRSMLTPEQLKELRQQDLDDLHVTIPRDSGKRKTPEDAINPFEEKSPKRQGRQSGDWFKAMDKKFGVTR